MSLEKFSEVFLQYARIFMKISFKDNIFWKCEFVVSAILLNVIFSRKRWEIFFHLRDKLWHIYIFFQQFESFIFIEILCLFSYLVYWDFENDSWSSVFFTYLFYWVTLHIYVGLSFELIDGCFTTKGAHERSVLKKHRNDEFFPCLSILRSDDLQDILVSIFVSADSYIYDTIICLLSEYLV